MAQLSPERLAGTRQQEEQGVQQKTAAAILIASFTNGEVGSAVKESLGAGTTIGDLDAVQQLAARNLVDFDNINKVSPFIIPAQYLVQFFKLSAWAELVEIYARKTPRGYGELLEVFGRNDRSPIEGLTKFYRDRFSMWPIFRAFAAAYGSQVESFVTEVGKVQPSYLASLPVARRYETPAQSAEELRMRLQDSFPENARRYSGGGSIFKLVTDERRYNQPLRTLQSPVVLNYAGRDFERKIYNAFARYIDYDDQWNTFSQPFLKKSSQ